MLKKDLINMEKSINDILDKYQNDLAKEVIHYVDYSVKVDMFKNVINKIFKDIKKDINNLTV